MDLHYFLSCTLGVRAGCTWSRQYMGVQGGKILLLLG
jgi:hypothetical protein